MIQIIEQNKKPTFGQRLGLGVGKGLDRASQLMQEHEQKQMQNQQKKAISDYFGEDIANLNPELQKLVIGERLKGENLSKEYGFKAQNEEAKNALELGRGQEIEGRDYNVVKDKFGEKFAELWRSAPVGGKTELIKLAIDSAQRGQSMNDLLEGLHQENLPNQNTQETEENQNLPQIKTGQTGELDKFKWPNFTKRPPSYTDKEWNDEKKTWRKANSPIYLENKNKLSALSRDELGIKKLAKLNNSKKMPEGFERLLINPETGDFYGIAQLTQQVSPEAQEWVKEISRFGNRAKDAFGSRVTNFDLQTYMKQFPGLLNTPEGRSRIIRMMDVNNKLDKLYEGSLQKVFNKYGLNSIPPEKAEELAQGFIRDEAERLRTEYVGLDEENQLMEKSKENELSGKMIDVIGPDGETYEVDEREVEMLPPGYKVI